MMCVVKMAALLAPEGRLRFSINLGNPVLARRDDPKAEPHGVSVDIAKALAERLNATAEFVVVTSARQSFETVSSGRADIGFFAVDPDRSDRLGFTAPYLHIEGWYAVRDDSPIRTLAEVDQPGHRVALSHGSAYDLFLSRALKKAEIVRAPNPLAVTPIFLMQHVEVMAAVRQQLDSDMATTPGLRLLPGRFMCIEQSVGFRRSFGSEAARYLSAFVEELKEKKRIDAFLARHAICGATVAPSAKSEEGAAD